MTNKPQIPRVLHLSSSPEPLGGVWTYIRHITESRLQTSYNFCTELYPQKARGISLSILKKLRERISFHAPDLIHIHGLQTEGFHLALASRISGGRAVLLTVHGFIEDSKFRNPRRQEAIKLLEKLTLRLVQRFYCVSKYGDSKRIVQQFRNKSVGVIQNAIPEVPGEPAGQTLRRDPGITGDDITLLYVGRLSREKGVLLIPGMIRHVLDLGLQRVRVLVVGDGPDKRALVEEVAANRVEHAVTLLGAIKNPTDIYSCSDAFLLPSFHEHQSFSILEAMRAERPVLAFAVGGNPELVIHGETGMLAKPFSTLEMAKNIVLLAKDPCLREEQGRRGALRQAQLFNMDSFLTRVDAAYRDILSCPQG